MNTWFVVIATATAGGAAWLVHAAARATAEERVRSFGDGAGSPRRQVGRTDRTAMARWGVASAALIVVAWIPALLLLAMLLGPVVLGLRVLEDARRARNERAAVSRGLPLALDLAAAALAAGLPLPDALASAGQGAGPPFDARWQRASGFLRMGGAPADAVEHDSADHEALVVVQEGMDAGMPLADLLRGLAEARREGAKWEAEAAARRVAVRVVLPLAACFLPAFILLGVVPVVVGLFSSLGI